METAFLLATFLYPEKIGTTPLAMLWVLPLVASIAIVYKATKVDTIEPGEARARSVAQPEIAVSVAPVHAVAGCTNRRKLGKRAKQAAVVGHVEHCHKLDAPRVALGAFALVDEHRNPAIDFLGELGVSLATEDGAGPGVGVNERDLVRG